MSRPPKRLGAALVVVLAAACAQGGHSDGARARARTTAPLAASGNPTSTWATYHRTNSRAADAGSTAPWLTGTLRVRWSKKLDGAVYGQTILVGTNAVAATENNTVYALNVSTGAVVWSRHLGTPARRSALPCGNIDPLGITGTPAYDVATGSVFVVA
jgi:outer membrane protein assembly factor BamB